MPDKNVPGSIYVSAGTGYSTAFGVVGESQKPTTITVENTEQMEKMNNTKYQTYTVGSRILVDAERYQIPILCKSGTRNESTKAYIVLGID